MIQWAESEGLDQDMEIYEGLFGPSLSSNTWKTFLAFLKVYVHRPACVSCIRTVECHDIENCIYILWVYIWAGRKLKPHITPASILLVWLTKARTSRAFLHVWLITAKWQLCPFFFFFFWGGGGRGCCEGGGHMFRGSKSILCSVR